MSGSTLIAAPALEAVTVEEARSQCRITDSTEDGLLAGYILAARHLVEELTGRVLVTQTWTETYDRDWPRSGHCDHHSNLYPNSNQSVYSSRRIMLPRQPVQSVSSVKYVDTTGTTQTLDPSQYQFGVRQLVGVIEQAYGVCWPAVRSQMDAITVQYIAGYASIGVTPEGIRQAILLLVAHFYGNREAVVVPSSRAVPFELPIGVDALLASHVVPWVF